MAFTLIPTNKIHLMLNYEIRNWAVFMKMKLESTRRKRLNASPGLEPEERPLAFKCVHQSWILYWDVRNLGRSPGMSFHQAIDGINVSGREVRIDDL